MLCVGLLSLVCWPLTTFPFANSKMVALIGKRPRNDGKKHWCEEQICRMPILRGWALYAKVWCKWQIRNVTFFLEMPTAVTHTVTHAHIMFPAIQARARQTVRSQHINLTNLTTLSSCAMCNQLVFCPFLSLCPIFKTTWSSIKVKLPVPSAINSTTSSLTVNNAIVFRCDVSINFTGVAIFLVGKRTIQWQQQTDRVNNNQQYNWVCVCVNFKYSTWKKSLLICNNK